MIRYSSLVARPSRRRVLLLLGGALCAPASLAREAENGKRITPFAKVVPGYTFRFPYDEGSHPDFRIEWWYVTGWLQDQGEPLGFQVTFFRVRPDLKHENPSRFAPRQILIAHAALSDPAHGQLLHEQRAARAGFGLADVTQGRAHAWIDDWRLEQQDKTYRARIPARAFTIDLSLEAVHPPLLQGDNGFSRKGPGRESASYYYSIPQIRVTGMIRRGENRKPVTGMAWMDHEWSSQYLEKEASGWDWIGINLDGGGALMAFRMRDKGGAPLWAGGTLRHSNGRLETFAPGDVLFTPGRIWRSPRTGTRYPVTWTVRVGVRQLEIEPLFDDQEHDSRATTGTIYWEGAVRAREDGRPAGLGYLELTGYWRRPDL